MMHKSLLPRDDGNRLYVSSKEVERGLANIQDSINTWIQQQENYIKKCRGRQKAIQTIQASSEQK